MKYLLNDKVEYVHHKTKDIQSTRYCRADIQSDKSLYINILQLHQSTTRRFKWLTAGAQNLLNADTATAANHAKRCRCGYGAEGKSRSEATQQG